MNTKTTTNLRLRIREHYLLHEPAIRHALEGATFVVALVLISRLLAPPASNGIRVIPLQTSQPIVVIQRESAPTLPPLPTYTPAPTAEPIVIQAPAPAPEVIYVEAPQAAPEAPQQAEQAAPEVQAAPTPAAVYQTMSEQRQQNIQQHYIDIPTRAPLQDDDVTRNWAAEQWRAEHCIGGVCH